MNYIKGVYDSSSKRLFLEFKSKLLESHCPLFEKVFNDFLKRQRLPKGSELQSATPEKCMIVIPAILKEADKLKDGDRIENIPPEIYDMTINLLDEFTRKAIKAEFSNVEFIPLSGYPLKKLQEDLMSAIKDRQDLCLIDTFENYRKFNKKEITAIKQYRVSYKSSEWADIALTIQNGDEKELRKYNTKLILTTWP